MRNCLVGLAVVTILLGGVGQIQGSILLDADTPATGSNLDTAPLVTPYGTITFTGEIRGRDGDEEFNAAGALGDVFDILNTTSTAAMDFDFDVAAITFIYGGNLGVFDIVALDSGGSVVDSFFQRSTHDGQPAGPVTLSGNGIRRIFWQDPRKSFSPIDNVTIETDNVPEPATLAIWSLIGLFGIGLGWRRRHKAA